MASASTLEIAILAQLCRADMAKRGNIINKYYDTNFPRFIGGGF
jgi:hypothetical protein